VLRVTRYALRVACYVLRVASCELRVSGRRMPIPHTSYRLPLTLLFALRHLPFFCNLISDIGHQLSDIIRPERAEDPFYRIRVTHRLPITDYRLPITDYLVTGCWLLVTGYWFTPFGRELARLSPCSVLVTGYWLPPITDY
jgi:hypothetical protein